MELLSWRYRPCSARARWRVSGSAPVQVGGEPAQQIRAVADPVEAPCAIVQHHPRRRLLELHGDVVAGEEGAAPLLAPVGPPGTHHHRHLPARAVVTFEVAEAL